MIHPECAILMKSETRYYCKFFFRSFLQIAVKYGGVDIPGSPFLMTSNPNIEDVVNAALAEAGTHGGLGSRKGSALSPERSYAKNGTGLQRGSIAGDGKGDGDISDLIRNTLPGRLF